MPKESQTPDLTKRLKTRDRAQVMWRRPNKLDNQLQQTRRLKPLGDQEHVRGRTTLNQKEQREGIKKEPVGEDLGIAKRMLLEALISEQSKINLKETTSAKSKPVLCFTFKYLE